jgi:hypothetical protein
VPPILEPMRRVPTSLVAAASLLAGFGVAELTGVRVLGGLVLFAAALWCGLRWRAALGLGVALGLVLAYLAGFVASHPLGHAIGSWPAVALVAAVVGAVVWAVADRPAHTHPEPA